MTGERVRDRRAKSTFWIDDVIVDVYGPVLGAFPFGAAALAVYAVLSRRALHGESFPGKLTIAEQAACSKSTADRAVRLLELLGLVDVAYCFDAATGRQTTNLYTLLTPPAVPPAVDEDWRAWPEPLRDQQHVDLGGGRRVVIDARERVVQEASNTRSGGCQADRGEGISLRGGGYQPERGEGISLIPLNRNLKDAQIKETPLRTDHTDELTLHDRATAAKRELAERDPSRPPGYPIAAWISAAAYDRTAPERHAGGGFSLVPGMGRDTTLAWARLHDQLEAERRTEPAPAGGAADHGAG